ncbi:MAG: RsbRD N-terminal domain-containing protein [Candidatus Aquicultor sp.]
MEMKLEDILKEKKPAILQKWFDAILATYSPEYAGLLKGRKNRFTDPVGYTLYDGMNGLIDGLIKEAPFEEITPFLDEIIKIRAVQDFSASQAVAFIFDLRRIVNEELQNMSGQSSVIDASIISAFESKLDTLALMSFDIYMESREKLYELKASEVRDRAFRLLQREYQLLEMQEKERSEFIITDLPRGENHSHGTQGQGPKMVKQQI